MGAGELHLWLQAIAIALSVVRIDNSFLFHMNSRF